MSGGDASEVDRRALGSVAVQFFANGATYATIVPRLPDIRDRVGISIGALGLILTIGSLASLAGSLLTGRVVGVVGSRRVLIYGAVLSIGFLPVIGFATTPVVLAIGLFGLLFFDVFIDVAMNVQGSAISARRHTPVMNRLHGLWSLGTVAGGVVTVLLLRAGVSTPVQLTAVALVLVGALMFVAPGLLRRDEAPELAESARAVTARPRRRATGLVGIALGAGGATAMAIEMANGDWASFRLTDDLGAAPGVAGAAFLVFTAGMTVGRLSGDWIQVRVGRDRLVRAAAVTSFVGALLATLVASVPVAITGFLIGGLGCSVFFPQLYDQAARSQAAVGSGFATMLVGQRGSGMVVPLIVGGLANTAALDVGQAMAIVIVPSTIVMFLTTLVPTTVTGEVGPPT